MFPFIGLQLHYKTRTLVQVKGKMNYLKLQNSENDQGL
jgi:hypothetical protein